MNLRLLSAADAKRGRLPIVGDLQLETITAPGRLLDVAYQLLSETFAPDVLPSLEFFLSSLSPASRRDRESRLLFVTASLPFGDERVLVGCSSAHLLRLEGRRELALSAIGNIAVSPHLPALGVRGVGSRLLAATDDAASSLATELGCRLAYGVAEAETRSLGFWRKQGYRRPEGLEYWQPPLEFQPSGAPLYPEVRETLVVRPIPPSPPETIERELVIDVIRTLYEQWSLRRQRSLLTPAAMAAAETYVMERVLKKSVATIPAASLVPLREP